MSGEHDNSQSEADATLPDVGEDLAPTSEMIVQGKIGNGSYDRFTPQLAKRIQVERAEMKREIARSRRESYEEGMRDALQSVGSLQTGIVEQGAELLQRLQAGEELSPTELGTLKLAQSTAKEIADRAIGKPKTTAEVKTQTNILHLIAGIENG